VPDTSQLTTPQYDRTQFVRCNTLGHSWYDYDSNWAVPSGTAPLTLRCERCGTERRDIINALGLLVGRSYSYPDGYRYGRGERPARSDFRMMLLQERMKEARKARRSS
jgi:hypothetical protein